MITLWERRDDYWTNTTSAGFDRDLKYRGYLEIRALGLSGLREFKKNDLRMLRHGTSEPLRQENSKGAGSFLWGFPCLSGDRGAPGRLQNLRKSETGKARMAFRQPLLYKTLFSVRRQEVSFDDHQGCRGGTEPGLAHGKRIGQEIHVRTNSSSGGASTRSDRHRRNIHQKRPFLPHRGERPEAEKTNLVRRNRPLRKKHGWVLCVAWAKEIFKDQARCHGYVESVRKISQEKHPESSHSLRQISCYEASRRGIGYNQEAGIYASCRERPFVHQGAEIYLIVQQGESNAGRPQGPQKIAPGKQTSEYGLSAQGILWSIMGLSNRRLGAAVLRELEDVIEMAAPEAFREVCQDDRKTLGRNCGIQQTREQGVLGFCGGLKQQDQGNSKTRLRSQRRRLLEAENTHVYARKDINLPTQVRDDPFFLCFNYSILKNPL